MGNDMHAVLRVCAAAVMLAATVVVAPAAPAGATADGASMTSRAQDVDLLAAYGMEEESGGTVRDMSGNGHDGTVHDPLRVRGRIGKALRFDGAEDLDRVLNVPDAPGLRPGSALTVEAWFKPDKEHDETCDIWAKVLDSADASFGVSTHAFRVRAGGADHGEYYGSMPVGWWHFAVTYDGSKLRLYAGGELAIEYEVTGDLDYDAGPLRIGGGTQNCFSGIVDEFRLYRRALTAEEIQADMVTAIAPDARPSAVGNLTGDDSTGMAVLAWEPATDDHGVIGYEIHRNDGGDFVPSETTRVATVTGLSYTEGCVPQNTAYHYRVVAVDALPQTGPSTPIIVDNPRPDCPPTAPSIYATPYTGWAAFTLHSASDERGVAEVQLHRSTTKDFTPSAQTLVATLEGNHGNYQDHVPEAGTYHYRALARDTTGHLSEPSPVTTLELAAPPDLENTIRGAWAFDEDSGTVAADSAGGDNPGTLRGTAWEPGKIGNALKLPWQSGVMHADGWRSSGSVTLAAWVKLHQTGVRNVPLGHQSASNSDTVMSLYPAWSNGSPAVELGLHRYVTSDKVLPPGVWTHLAATYDGKVGLLYVNGELIPRRTQNTRGFDGPARLTLESNYIDLWVDELRSYDAALTPNQIKEIMNKPIR